LSSAGKSSSLTIQRPPKNGELHSRAKRHELLVCRIVSIVTVLTYGKRDFIYITGIDKLVYPITLQIGSKKYPEKVLMSELVLIYLYSREILRDFTTCYADLI
jgi:hypothetical protein